MLDSDEQKALDDIKAYGLHIIHVLGDENGPRFTYSVGLYHNYEHPEIVLMGLRQELAHTLLNNIAYDIKNGLRYAPHQFYDSILDGFQCYMLPVDQEHYHDYFGWAQWFYRKQRYPVLQCVYPSVYGLFPWSPDAPDDFTWFEPLLGTPDPLITGNQST